MSERDSRDDVESHDEGRDEGEEADSNSDESMSSLHSSLSMTSQAEAFFDVKNKVCVSLKH